MVIFHCEFSSVRAPTMLKALRTMDEQLSAGSGTLLYPEFYIMEGGYSTYCKDFMPTCSPQTYTKMKDKRYVQDNAQCESIMRRSWAKSGVNTGTPDDNLFEYDGVRRLYDTVRRVGITGMLSAVYTGVRAMSPQGGTTTASTVVSPRTPMSQIIA